MPRKAAPLQRASDAKRHVARVRRSYKVDLTKPKKLSPGEIPHVEHMVVVMKLAGYSKSQMARAIGISKSQCGRILEQPDVQEELAVLRDKLPQAALDLLQGFMIEAVMTIADVMRTEKDNKIVLQAAADILDRSGLPKASKSERTTVSETKITDDGIVEQLRQASPEIQEKAATIIEDLEKLLLSAAHDEGVDDEQSD